MKKIFLLLFTTTLFAQQNYQADKYTTRYRFTGDNILMDNEPHIGVIGIGYDLFGLIEKYPDIYFGVNSYSALSGDRAGIFSFGVSGGQKKKLYKTWSLDYGFFVGGGGGGGAADGGGLIIRPHLEVDKQITKNISLQAGVAHINFITGDISSTNVNFGITIDADAYLICKTAKTAHFSTGINEKYMRIALVSTLHNSFQKGPVESTAFGYKGEKIGLIGISLERFLNKNTFAILEFNGAITGGVDGFMSYFLGVGYDMPIIKDKLFLEGRLLGGPSGGGAVASGGGASFQAEVGLGVVLFKKYELKFLAGKTFAPWGDFETQHFDVQLAKRFSVFNGIKKVEDKNYNVQLEDYKYDELSLTTFNRTYIPPRLRDKNGVLYDEFFNLIGFEVEKKMNKTISVLGSTVWAYQGSYGAYGEGWLGVQAGYDFTSKDRVNAKVMVGAGGGGALKLGSGLLTQYNVGYERYINSRFNFIANVGQFKPVEGNFDPIFIDFGIKFKMNQLIKKR